jgi:MFS family permease
VPARTALPGPPEPAPLLDRLPFYYGWVNLVVAAWAMTATLPGRTHGLGLIEQALLDDLAVSPVLFSVLNFCAVLLGALLCLPTGLLIDRLGARPVLTGVALGLGAAVLAMSGVTEPVGLFVTLTLVRGLGQGALSVVSMALVGKWFTRRLGPAMGWYTVLLGVGFMLTTPLVGYAAQAAGWREAWAGVGLSLLLGLAPAGWLLARSSPEGCGLPVESAAPAPDAPAPAAPDRPLGAALLSPAFWVFTLAAALFNLMWSALTLFQQPILEEHGFGPTTFLVVMTVLATSGLPSNLIGGWLTTRWPMGRVLALGMLAFAASLALFPAVTTPAQVVLYAALLGTAGGLITVVFFAVYGHAFGRTHLGQVQAVVQVITVFASALGPVLLTACKEHFGSFDVLFQAVVPPAVGLGVAAWAVPLRGPAAPAAAEMPVAHRSA